MGSDEHLNLASDDAEEVHITNRSKKTLKLILLKGDNIILLYKGS